MAIHALEGLDEQWYEPEGQSDEPRTAFLIRPLDGAQMTHLQLMLDGLRMTGEAVQYALDTALKDWRHVVTSAGELPFTRDNVRLLPMPVRIDLASKIYETSLLSEDQAKN